VRVLITGINYCPEPSGIGPYTAGLAEHLAARGDDDEMAREKWPSRAHFGLERCV
jgi:hypothetical protein